MTWPWAIVVSVLIVCVCVMIEEHLHRRHEIRSEIRQATKNLKAQQEWERKRQLKSEAD